MEVRTAPMGFNSHYRTNVELLAKLNSYTIEITYIVAVSVSASISLGPRSTELCAQGPPFATTLNLAPPRPLAHADGYSGPFCFASGP